MSSTPTPSFHPTSIPGLRSPYVRVGGVVHFARMLDKIRLNREGSLPPAWVEAMGHPRGLDTACCGFLGINYAALKANLLTNPTASDQDMLEWAFQHGRRPTSREIQTWSDSMMKRGWRDAFAERVRFRLREVGLPEDAVSTVFDFIEVDEGRTPPAILPSE